MRPDALRLCKSCTLHCAGAVTKHLEVRLFNSWMSILAFGMFRPLTSSAYLLLHVSGCQNAVMGGNLLKALNA